MEQHSTALETMPQLSTSKAFSSVHSTAQKETAHRGRDCRVRPDLCERGGVAGVHCENDLADLRAPDKWALNGCSPFAIARRLAAGHDRRVEDTAVIRDAAKNFRAMFAALSEREKRSLPLPE